MPNLAQYQSGETTKAIVMGDSGGGKSGALASLAHVGYKLHIMDTDNGLDVLKNLLLDPNSRYSPKAIENVDAITITEKMVPKQGIVVPASAKAWSKCISLFDKWDDGQGLNLGSIFTWGPQDILVIDSLTMLCNFCMNHIKAMNNRLQSDPYQSDWGEAQRQIEAVLQTLYDSQLKCNVIVNCHITRIGQEESVVSEKGVVSKYTVSGTERGYPSTLGKALSPKVGRYFNTALLCEGGKIYTKTRGIVNLKNTNPVSVPGSFPLETGLADYFKAVRR